MMFQRTTSINKILALTKRKKVIQGGTWAGKTYGILAVIINFATLNKERHITVVAETIPSLKGGALKQFKEIMQITNRWQEARFNGTDLFYKFANGTIVEFKSFDSVGKAQASGKRTDLFINEAPYINYDIADSLIMRTTGNVWIDFNPTIEFWGHTEILTNQDAEFLLLKYTDNEALPETILSELKMKMAKAKAEVNPGYWTNWCRVYIDGEIGTLQGTVFTFEQCKVIPEDAKFIAYGIDWGFSNDPTALIEVYRFNGELYINELIYKTGLTNSDIIQRMNELEVNKHEDMIADSAEPKSIEDLYRGGYNNIYPADKGADSIRSSIDTLQQFKLNVTETSLNVIKELRSYRWATDKDGKTTNKPEDKNNHTLDALRYVALNKINKGEGEYSFL